MRSDDATPPRDVPFRMVGEGLAQTFRCGQCQDLRAMVGRRLQLVKKGPMRGTRDWVCITGQGAAK